MCSAASMRMWSVPSPVMAGIAAGASAAKYRLVPQAAAGGRHGASYMVEDVFRDGREGLDVLRERRAEHFGNGEAVSAELQEPRLLHVAEDGRPRGRRC